MPVKKWRKRGKLLLILLLTFPFLSGCWDRLEIEERATILGIAVDVADPESERQEENIAHTEEAFPRPKKGMIRLSAQIAVPGRLPLGPGQEGGGGGGTQKPVWVLSVVGHTIDDAMSNLQQQLADKIFMGHLRVIVISEAYAKKGINELNDYLRRNSEVRRAAWMVVSKGKADRIMDAAPELERVPTLYLLSTMDEAVRMGKFPDDFLGVFWSIASSKGQEPYLPYIEIRPKENVRISGMAYFRGERMVGVTEPLEIAFYMAIKEINPGGYTALTPIKGKAESVMFEAVTRKSKITLEIKNGRPHVTVKVHVEGDIREKSNPEFAVNNHDAIRKIEQEVAKNAKIGFNALVKKTQKHGSDIFGFGEYVRAKEPQYWNEQIKTKTKWQEMYKELPVDIHVTISIRRVGMKAR